MPTAYFLPTFLTASDYYPGMCIVDENGNITSEPPAALEDAMNDLLNESNKLPTVEARIVEDLWGDFE